MNTLKLVEGNALRGQSRYIYTRTGSVIDSDNGQVVEQFDNYHDARGTCESLNEAYAQSLKKFANSLPV